MPTRLSYHILSMCATQWLWRGMLQNLADLAMERGKEEDALACYESDGRGCVVHRFSADGRRSGP